MVITTAHVLCPAGVFAKKVFQKIKQTWGEIPAVNDFQ
jgi:hypothetical protein